MTELLDTAGHAKYIGIVAILFFLHFYNIIIQGNVTALNLSINIKHLLYAKQKTFYSHSHFSNPFAHPINSHAIHR